MDDAHYVSAGRIPFSQGEWPATSFSGSRPNPGVNTSFLNCHLLSPSTLSGMTGFSLSPAIRTINAHQAGTSTIAVSSVLAMAPLFPCDQQHPFLGVEAMAQAKGRADKGAWAPAWMRLPPCHRSRKISRAISKTLFRPAITSLARVNSGSE